MELCDEKLQPTNQNSEPVQTSNDWHLLGLGK